MTRRSHEELRVFLLAHVDTFEVLEILLAMHEHPEVVLTAEQAALQLDLPPDDVRRSLEQLVARGFCVKEPGPAYRYEPRPALRDGVQDLADVRATSPGTIARLMSMNATEKIRTMTAEVFADAFIFRRRKRDG
jgi:hypothetical protein